MQNTFKDMPTYRINEEVKPKRYISNYLRPRNILKTQNVEILKKCGKGGGLVVYLATSLSLTLPSGIVMKTKRPTGSGRIIAD